MANATASAVASACSVGDHRAGGGPAPAWVRWSWDRWAGDGRLADRSGAAESDVARSRVPRARGSGPIRSSAGPSSSSGPRRPPSAVLPSRAADRQGHQRHRSTAPNPADPRPGPAGRTAPASHADRWAGRRWGSAAAGAGPPEWPARRPGRASRCPRTVRASPEGQAVRLGFRARVGSAEQPQRVHGTDRRNDHPGYRAGTAVIVHHRERPGDPARSGRQRPGVHRVVGRRRLQVARHHAVQRGRPAGPRRSSAATAATCQAAPLRRVTQRCSITDR